MVYITGLNASLDKGHVFCESLQAFRDALFPDNPNWSMQARYLEKYRQRTGWGWYPKDQQSILELSMEQVLFVE